MYTTKTEKNISKIKGSLIMYILNLLHTIKVELQTEQGDIEVGRVVYILKNNEIIYGGADNNVFRTDIIEGEDYFKDRSKESTQHQSLNRGDTVYIVENRMQDFAMGFNDLAKGVIKRITRCDNPRGVEVQIVNEYDFGTVGRVIYLEKNGKILYGAVDK